METESMQSSPVVESEKDCNYLYENTFGVELNLEPVNVEKKVYQFYFVKFWPCKDENVKSRIEEAQKLIVELNQETGPKIRKSSTSMFELLGLNGELRGLRYQESSLRQSLASKTKDLDDLLEALEKLNFSRNAYRMLHGSNNLATEKKLSRQIKESQERGAVNGSFSSVEEFSALTRRMYSEMQHQSKNKTKDEQFFGEIKQLERGRNKSIIDHIRLINKISEDIRKDLLKVKNKIKRVKKELEVLEKDTDTDTDTDTLTKQIHRQKQVNREILQLKKQLVEQDVTNSRYDRYVSVMSNARELGRKNDVKALEELSLQEVDVFMSKWNGNEDFRYSYERSILPSLDKRQLSRDGRMRNFNEQPINLEAPMFFKLTNIEMVAQMRYISDPIVLTM